MAHSTSQRTRTSRRRAGTAPCQVCGVTHDKGSKTERAHQLILERRGGVATHLGDGILPPVDPPIAQQQEDHVYANAVIYPEADPWSDDVSASHAEPYNSPEHAQRNPEVRFFFAQQGKNTVRRQPLVINAQGEVDFSVTDDNQEAIRRIARQRFGFPEWADFDRRGDITPLPITGVSDNGVGGATRIPGHVNDLLDPPSLSPERNFYYVSADGSEAISVAHAGATVRDFMAAGATIGMTAPGPDGLPRLHHIGSIADYERNRNHWNDTHQRLKTGSRGGPVRCEYCGRNHFPDSAVRIQHQILRDRRGMDTNAPLRQVAEYEARLNEQIVDDLRMQAELARHVDDRTDADAVEQDDETPPTPSVEAESNSPQITPQRLQEAVDKVLSELGIKFTNNPRASSKGTNPGTGAKVYGMLGDDSTEDDDPLYAGGASGPRRKYGKPLGVDAPGLPGNVGSVHVPSLIAMAINRPSRSSTLNGCVGDVSTLINKTERSKSLRLATDWYTNEMLRNRGVRPGTWAARRVLRRNRDKIDSFRNQAADRLLTAQHMRKKFAQDPQRYAPGSPGYIAELKRDTEARAQRREKVDSGAPVGRIDFLVGMTNATRGQGVGGAWRFYRRFRRARKVDRAIARRRRIAERRAAYERDQRTTRTVGYDGRRNR